MDCLTAIRARRTRKTYTGEAVPRADLETMLDAARWAPTHRLSEPWRFTVLERAAIAELGAWLASRTDLHAQPDPAKGAAKWAKLAAALPTLGALVIATWARADDPAVDAEDHAAASAAVQNLLLAATALGWASYWSSTPLLSQAQTLGHLGIDAQREGCLGAIWLGRDSGAPAPTPPRRPLAERVRWR